MKYLSYFQTLSQEGSEPIQVAMSMTPTDGTGIQVINTEPEEPLQIQPTEQDDPSEEHVQSHMVGPEPDD